MLSIDGVLHPLLHYGQCFRTENITPLWKGIENHDVSIVITSRWRYSRTLEWLKDNLGPLSERIIGQTELSLDVPEEFRRQHEVEHYLQQFPEPIKWIAVDNIRYNYKPGTPLVLTDEGLGFTEQDAKQLEVMIIQLENNETIIMDSEYGKKYYVPKTRVRREKRKWRRKIKDGAEVYQTCAGQSPERIFLTTPADFHAWLDDMEQKSGILKRIGQMLRDNAKKSVESE